MVDVGSDNWFILEAQNSIHKIDDDVWDFTDSALLYSDKGVKAYQSIQERETSYSKRFTSVEHDLLKSIASKVTLNLPRSFNYIDIGPGTERKEKYFFKAFREEGKVFSYFPIDINKKVAQEAAEFAQLSGIEAVAIHGRFEDPEIITSLPTNGYNFVSLGATFANFDASELLTTLKKLIGNNGKGFITAQLRDRIDVTETANSYLTPGAIEMFKAKMELIGLNEGDYEDFETTDEITVFTRLKNVSTKMMQKGLKPGDKIIILKTYRYKIDTINKMIRKVFNQIEIFDKGTSFVGVDFL